MIKGAQWTISATAAKLTTILGLSEPVFCRFVNIRNKTGAANALYVGGSTVANDPANAWAEIAAGGDLPIAPGGDGQLINTDKVYLVGTANAANIAFVLIVS